VTDQTTTKRRGRPPGITGPRLPADQRASVPLRARLTPAHAAKYEALGGVEWLRRMLDRARV